MSRLLIIFIAIAAAYIFFKGLRGFFYAFRSKMGPRPRSVTGGKMVRDPACGVYLPIEKAVEGQVEGALHYFCSSQCLETYRTAAAKKEKEPEEQEN